LANSHHGWASTSDRTRCKAAFPLGHTETSWSSKESEGLSNVKTETVEEELLGVVTDTVGKDLLDIATDMVEGVLSDAMMDTADEELAEIMTDTATGGLTDVMTDTIDKELLGRTIGTVAGAVISYHSEAHKPARLCLKSSKSFLVIVIQSAIGEPSSS